MQSLRLAATLVVLGMAASAGAWAQRGALELMLPGNEYQRGDLPADPAGTWLVLHGRAGETLLEASEVVVTPFQTCGDERPDERSGRAVRVPAAPDAILLLRGDAAPEPGPVATAFVDLDGAGAADRVEAPWRGETVVVRRIVQEPSGDRPGSYRIELTVGDRRFPLHADPWDGEGHWRVWWIGDLNRDGWPDLLVDASYKYSVYTTRLYLTVLGDDGGLRVVEAATFSHSAC